MNAQIVTEASAAATAGTIQFPEMVQRLVEAGVEYYHVDYVTLRKTCYSGTGDVVPIAIHFEGLPPIAADFDEMALRAAIRDSQTQGLPYRDFTRRAMAAGVQGYYVFLRGQRVTYFGRTGDQHTEWFPGAGPAKSK